MDGLVGSQEEWEKEGCNGSKHSYTDFFFSAKRSASNFTFFEIVKYKAMQTNLQKKVRIYLPSHHLESHLGAFSIVLIFERDNENRIFSFPLGKQTCVSVISAVFQGFLTLEYCKWFRENSFKVRSIARRSPHSKGVPAVWC